MRRITVIHGLHRAILARVPKAHRAEVRAMQHAEIDIWCAAMQGGEAEAFNAGVMAEREHHAAVEAVGFEAGHHRGIAHVMGHVGSPARRMDDDEMTIQPS